MEPSDDKYTLRLLTPEERMRIALEYFPNAKAQLTEERLVDTEQNLRDLTKARDVLRIMELHDIPVLTTQLELEQLDFLFGLDNIQRKSRRQIKLMSSYLTHGELSELEEIFATADITYLSDTRSGPMVRLQITAASLELSVRHRELHERWVRNNHNVGVKGLDEVSWLLAEHTNHQRIAPNNMSQSYSGLITPARANWQADTTNWREQLAQDASRHAEYAEIREWIMHRMMDKEAVLSQALLLDTPSQIYRVTGIKDNGMFQLSSKLESDLTFDLELPYSFMRPDRGDGSYRLYLSSTT